MAWRGGSWPGQSAPEPCEQATCPSVPLQPLPTSSLLHAANGLPAAPGSHCSCPGRWAERSLSHWGGVRARGARARGECEQRAGPSLLQRRWVCSAGSVAGVDPVDLCLLAQGPVRNDRWATVPPWGWCPASLSLNLDATSSPKCPHLQGKQQAPVGTEWELAPSAHRPLSVACTCIQEWGTLSFQTAMQAPTSWESSGVAHSPSSAESHTQSCLRPGCHPKATSLGTVCQHELRLSCQPLTYGLQKDKCDPPSSPALLDLGSWTQGTRPTLDNTQGPSIWPEPLPGAAGPLGEPGLVRQGQHPPGDRWTERRGRARCPPFQRGL